MMPSDRHATDPLRCHLGFDRLEQRELPASFTFTPVVPTIDSDMTDRLREVIQQGQSLGNHLDVFSRVGDSITYSNNFLVPLGTPSIDVDNAGDGSLNDTLGYFRGGVIGAGNSFTSPSLAAFGGWTSADVLAHLPGELVSRRPAFVFAMAGTNDIALGIPVETYRQNLTAIVNTALSLGVVPVLSTIPDIPLFPAAQAKLAEYNQTVQDVGELLQVPVWNYWRALQKLPSSGIGPDGVHPSVAPDGGGDLTQDGLEYGYNVRNLTALQTLDKLRRVLLLGQSPDLPNQDQGWVSLTSAGAVAVATGDSTGFQVQLVDPQTRKVLLSFDAFGGFHGSVRVTLGDVNRDGVPDLVAATGPGGPPHVKVFDGVTGAVITSFYAFDAGYTGGLSVAVGDVNGDGAGDIVVGSLVGSHVKTFTTSGELLNSFFAFDSGFVGGVQVAATDVNGDGFADVVVAAGNGGHGNVAVFSVATDQKLVSFFVFGPEFGGLISIAAGDFSGTGEGQIAVGVAGGAASHVVVMRPLTGERVNNFFAYDESYRGGVDLNTFTHDGRTDLLTTSNTAADADVRQYDALSGVLEDRFVLYAVGFRRGATFGG